MALMPLRFERRMVSNVPWGLVVPAVLVAVIGVWNLASASRPPHTPVWSSQALWVVVSLVVATAVSLFDYRFIQRAVIPIYVVNLAMLVALWKFGHTSKGAESWFAIGPVRVQPAEFMKIGMVLMLAKFFHDDYRPGDPPYGIFRMLVPLALGLVPIVLVLVQPDLGTALMMVFTAATMILFARVRWWVWVLILIAAVAAVAVVWNDWVREQPEPRKTLVRHHLKHHQDGRIAGWLDPEADPRGTNYHAIQSKIAVGSGKLVGKGWGQGTQTGLFFLPEQHTDFIFSVWAEEHGFVWCLLLIGLYGVVLVAAMGVAISSRDRFGAFVAVGIAAMIFWQIFENIGMVTGLLPVTGITLPLMSYGGSSMMSVMLGIGLLVNIGVRRNFF